MRIVTAEQPEPPAYFSYDAVLNTQERPTLEQALAQELRPLALGGRWRSPRGSGGAGPRDPADFAGAHLAGSVNIGLGGSYATWAGTVLDRGRPLVLVADLGREAEAAVRLGRIGFDNVAGYLEGGMQAVDARPDLLARIERVTAVALAERLAGSDPPLMLDVRAEREWRQARLGGSLNIPLGQLLGRLDEIPADRRLVVHCHTGYRSSIAASLLLREGREQIADLVGGISAWGASRANGGGAAHARVRGAAASRTPEAPARIPGSSSGARSHQRRNPARAAGRPPAHPNELFFVRNHGPIPEVDPAAYRLAVRGWWLTTQPLA